METARTGRQTPTRALVPPYEQTRGAEAIELSKGNAKSECEKAKNDGGRMILSGFSDFPGFVMFLYAPCCIIGEEADKNQMRKRTIRNGGFNRPNSRIIKPQVTLQTRKNVLY